MVRLQFWISGEYLFIAINSQVHFDPVVVFVRILFISQIDLFKNYLYLIELCTKRKHLRNNDTKM